MREGKRDEEEVQFGRRVKEVQQTKTSTYKVTYYSKQ